MSEHKNDDVDMDEATLDGLIATIAKFELTDAEIKKLIDLLRAYGIWDRCEYLCAIAESSCLRDARIPWIEFNEVWEHFCRDDYRLEYEGIMVEVILYFIGEAMPCRVDELMRFCSLGASQFTEDIESRGQTLVNCTKHIARIYQWLLENDDEQKVIDISGFLTYEQVIQQIQLTLGESPAGTPGASTAI